MNQLNEQALKIDEYFQKIINQIDVDTEYHINSLTSLKIKCEKENEYINHLNEKRNEFIEELTRIKQTNLNKFKLINSFVYLEIDSLFNFMKNDRKNGFLLIADYYLSDEEAKLIRRVIYYLDRFSDDRKNLAYLKVNLSGYYFAKLIINAMLDNKSILHLNKDQIENVAHIYINGRGADYSWDDESELDVDFDLEQFSKLEILDLHGNTFAYLRNLNDKQLLNAPYLKILDLSDGIIAYIEPGAFDNLVSLVELNLSNNLIEHLKSKQFVYCNSLKSIELIKNELKIIDSDSFEGLPALEKLSITIFRKIFLKRDIFEHFNGTLKIFKLDLTIYEELVKGFNDNWNFLNLEKLKNIEELELDMNNRNLGFNFNKIPNNLNKLKKFIMRTSICDLDLNQIFNRFNYVREIDIILNKSDLYHLNHYKFVNQNGFRLIEYTSLDEGYKKIKDLTTLENNLCVNFYTKEQMSLKIHKSDQLMNQSDLTKLELSRLKLDKDFLTNAKSLKTVILKYMEFEDSFNIRGALKNIKKLEKLELRECLFNGNMDEKVFSLLPHLKRLSINKNVENINKNLFINLKELVVLELNSNQLAHVESGLFMGLVNLKIINLSNSGIERIDKNAFEQLKNLETIYLSMNKLKNVDELFSNLFNLKEIDLSSNSLQSFNLNDIKKLKNIRKINLWQNGSILFDDHELLVELINLKRLAIFCDKSPWFFENKDIIFC